MPKNIQIQSTVLQLGRNDEATKLRTFNAVAYTGVAMQLVGFRLPVVVDLESLATPEKLPIFRDHDPSQIVGHADSIKANASELVVTGFLSGPVRVVTEIIEAADNGFPWQISLGARCDLFEEIAAKQLVKVNGKKHEGPVLIARSAVLDEVSFVPLGADNQTTVVVAKRAIRGGGTVTFDEWVTSLGLDPAVLSDEQKAALLEVYNKLYPPEGETTDGDQQTADAARQKVDLSTEQIKFRQQITEETKRVQAIRKICAAYKTPQITVENKKVDLETHAILEGWTTQQTELEALRAARPQLSSRAKAVVGVDDGEVLQAALAIAGRLQKPERFFSAQVLDQAHKRFRRGLSLQELLVEAARDNGYTGRSVKGDLPNLLRAAFSSLSLPGILGATANKFLLQGYEHVETVWQNFAAKRPVSDFKAVTSYRLNGSFQYEEVGPSGELKHDEIGETSYTNQAKTYGRMFAITRADIINDDLGALTVIPQRIGRGAALKLNDVFWTEFLDNSTFFSSGNANYFTGASTNLQASSLATALQKFRDQTDPDGKPIAVEPKYLLVPTALEWTAYELMQSGGQAPAMAGVTDATNLRVPTTNIWAGKFTPLVSAYLGNSSYTGYSATAWYLLADPMDAPVIEVCFLDGIESPIVESAEADFNVLGIQMRGFFDFGVSKQDFRGGVKSKGAA